MKKSLFRSMIKQICIPILIFALLFVPISGMTSITAKAYNPPSNLCTDAKGAILIDGKYGNVLFEKNSNNRLYPASTTKILTALLIIENGDLDDTVTVGDEVKKIPWDSSKANLKVGEQIPLRDILMGLMLPSGNDAALTGAVYIGRKINNNSSVSVDDAISSFCKLMNDRAKQLGASNSNFTNPHGYHDPNHYTTAKDLAIIAREAMKNQTFREVVATNNYKTGDISVLGGEGSKTNITHEWANSNCLLNKTINKYYYPYATGIKTGYTSDAGYCLVSSASKDGLDLISVVLNSNEKDRWVYSKGLFEYGFNNFKYHDLVSKEDIIHTSKVEGQGLNQPDILHAIAAEEFNDIVNKDDINKITQKIVWDDKFISESQNGEMLKILSSISKDQIIGKALYTLDENHIAEINLKAGEDIRKRTFADDIIYFLYKNYKYFIAFLILILLIRAKLHSKKRKRRKRKISKNK